MVMGCSRSTLARPGCRCSVLVLFWEHLGSGDEWVLPWIWVFAVT